MCVAIACVIARVIGRFVEKQQSTALAEVVQDTLETVQEQLRLNKGVDTTAGIDDEVCAVPRAWRV